MNHAKFKTHVTANARRQREFFASRQPGILVCPYTGTYTPPNFAEPRQETGLRGHVYRAVIQDDQRVVPDSQMIDRAVADFLREYRADIERQARPYFGDAIPAIHSYYDLAWTSGTGQASPRPVRGLAIAGGPICPRGGLMPGRLGHRRNEHVGAGRNGLGQR